MRKHRSLFVLSLMMAIMACTPSVPSKYIQPDDMEDILYDYHVAQVMAQTDTRWTNPEYSRQKYFLAVLQKYDVTEADFDSSLVYYYSHVDYLKKIYSNVNERLADEAKSLGASVGAISQYSQYDATGDTANIWKEATDVLLMPLPTINRYDFTVKADSSFHQGDSFMFQFFTEYLWQNGSKDAVVCIVSEYEGDSIIQTVNHVSVSGVSQIRIPANRENKLRKMVGFIYLSDGSDNSDTRKMMFISQIQLIRFHNRELKHDESENAATKADSLQRIDNLGGEMSDSAGRRVVGRRPGGTPLLAPDRDGPHRVDARPLEPKKK
jgi:hypothetical protein